jgi:predicted ATPase/class 3 adenylate cyclase
MAEGWHSAAPGRRVPAVFRLPGSWPTYAPAVAGKSLGAFLMTDIVGSTRLWFDHPEFMGDDLARHDRLLSGAISGNGGETISTAGDSFAAAFADPKGAVEAAVCAQSELDSTPWEVPGGIRVRMGVHVGRAQRRGEGWFGPPLNEAARMMAVAHGGQIVASEPLVSRLPDVDFVDLGEHHLRDLDGPRRLFQVERPGCVEEFPPLRTMASFETNLPAQRTSLIGRDDVIRDIRRLLVDHRLVTLLGPGGVGKTRAAIEAAAGELASTPGGVFFVDLTTAADREGVLSAVLSGLRTAAPPDVPAAQHLGSHLGDRSALVVVDNCEHVVEPVAEVVDQLLSAAPGLRVLATSRQALDAYGETRLVVPALDVSGPDSEGVRLFTERALDADSDLLIDEAAIAAIVEIGQRLDGIPLAIELAAAQSRTFTPTEVLAHIDDRFRFLRRAPRGSPARQRTLEATVEWSYELLDEPERRAFRQLSICAGPFTVTTAARLLGSDELEAADHLDALVSRSLVAPVRLGGRRRGFRYLETLRVYGQRQLAQYEETAGARSALEAALLPVPELVDDWNALVNYYICGNDLDVVIEDGTRRDAAAHAYGEGRLDAAAFISSSCVFHTDPGSLETGLAMVTDLVGRRHELHPTAWRAVAAAKVALERLTRRYEDCLVTSISMLDQLSPEDPARDWFDFWRAALTTAIAPEEGIAEIDAVTPVAADHARPPRDWILSQLLSCKATGLAILRRLDGALETAEQALPWAPVGNEARDQALALVAWLHYLMGRPTPDSLHEDVAGQHQELGLAELCAAPAAIAGHRPLEDRAAALVSSARRRPTTDVPTPYLLAFAWLAVEEGDAAHARELAERAESYDASTQVALIHLLATLERWPDEQWTDRREAAMGHYLHPDHEPVAKEGPAVLAQELQRWGRRLRDRPAA